MALVSADALVAAAAQSVTAANATPMLDLWMPWVATAARWHRISPITIASRLVNQASARLGGQPIRVVGRASASGFSAIVVTTRQQGLPSA